MDWNTQISKNLEHYVEAYRIKTGRSMRQASLNATGTAYAIRDILRGRVDRPRADVIADLAMELGCTTDELIGVPKRAISRTNTISLPEIEARIGAGSGQEVDSAAVLDTWVLPLRAAQDWHVDPETTVVMEVSGSSNMPVMQDGDRVMVDTQLKQPTSGDIYAIHDGTGLVAKRVFVVRKTDDDLILALHSFNPEHPVYERSASECQIVGRVVGVLKQSV